MLLREILFVVALYLGLPIPASPAPLETVEQPLQCDGQAVQGGLVLCAGPAGVELTVAGPEGEARRVVQTNASGLATIGLLRNETATLTITAERAGLAPLTLDIGARDDAFHTIEGLDCDKVDARTPDQKAHAARSWQIKQTAFDTFSEGPGAREGFLRPATGPMSSPFGPTRKYIGIGKDGEPCDKTSVHYGYDIAIPVGTEIVAPAAGTVTLGDPDLYYEGGTVFLDHGDGLVSVFMHMSAVDVAPGDVVTAGQRLGASGNTGRTTGPHLHWAVKWRNPANPDRGQDFYIDPALLMALPRAP